MIQRCAVALFLLVPGIVQAQELVQLSDINPGAGNSRIEQMVRHNNLVYSATVPSVRTSSLPLRAGSLDTVSNCSPE